MPITKTSKRTGPISSKKVFPLLKSFLRKNNEKPLAQSPIVQVNSGSGKPGDPFRLSLRAEPNTSGCFHCPTSSCHCVKITNLLEDVFRNATKKRITEVAGHRDLCAKSLLPPFVSRLIRLMNISREDTFYDLGCGNGSILFQVACLTGAKCVGVEISNHNAELAREGYEVLRLKMKAAGLPEPNVTIITGDIGEFLSDMDKFDKEQGKTAILISNLLFPKSLTHFMSEKFRKLPRGCRIACFDDLYPHGRSIAAIRDPEAFELFDMKDYMWQEFSVEWCWMEGPFYIHWRK